VVVDLDIPIINKINYQVSDLVLVGTVNQGNNNQRYFILDFIRRPAIGFLFIIFIVLVLVITKKQGIMSILGMGFSFLVIFYFILPKILSGADPVGASILGSLLIIPVSFSLSHGLNKKTIAAVIGTLIALIITGVLADLFVKLGYLTGYASEEASFLEISHYGLINMRGLLLAGILIGVLGVLDDIAVSQAAIVFQLKKTNKNLTLDTIYKKAMLIGEDHIASMVNTLVLVYTGASLPLLLLFLNNSQSFLTILNYEIVAQEIIRTLVGSIGLILSVPITTFISVMMVKEK